MDILKKYWFWFGSGLVIITLIVLRVVLIGGVTGEFDKSVKKTEKESKKISKKAEKASKLPNQKQIAQAKKTIAKLEAVQSELSNDLEKRNRPLDMYFGFEQGTLTDNFPDPVSYKESYGNEVRALYELISKYPEVETGLLIDPKTNLLTPGAFELSADLYQNGKISEEDIPLNQKRFWIQKYIINSLLSAEVDGVEIAPIEELEKNKIEILKSGQASDGSKPVDKYKEALYKKKYRVEKINKVTVDNGLRYDTNHRFRLFKVSIDCEMQLSLVPKVLKSLIAIEPMIVKIRDLQVISNLSEDNNEKNDELMNRYKEPAVRVEITLYGLDYLNKKERELVASLLAGGK